MPMKLYGAVMSPFVRKTRVVLALKGLNLTAKIAPLMFGIPPGTAPSIPPAAMM